MKKSRQSVSVICPFAGSADDAHRVAARLTSIALQPGDELLIVDNTCEQVAVGAGLPPSVSIVPAPEEQSSYFARNRGAWAATASWLLYIDSDCIPTPTLLDDYLMEPVPDRCGAIAGAVISDDEGTIAARYANARGVLEQAHVLAHPFRPYAATANLLVRGEALTEVGGFREGIRSAGDADFCWRLQEAGWTLEHRPAASVRHEHRTSALGLWRQFARYGAGAAWLRRAHGAPSTHSLAPARLLELTAGPVVALARRRPEEAAFRVFDLWVAAATLVGSGASNRAAPPRTDVPAVAVVAETYPHPSVDAAVRELQAAGERVIVSAASRGTPKLEQRWAEAFYDDDDALVDRVMCVAWSLKRARIGATPKEASTARKLSRRRVEAVRASGQPRTAERATAIARLLGIPNLSDR